MFKTGDRVRLLGDIEFARAKKGATATVGERGIYEQSWGGPYVDIVWDRDDLSSTQSDGGYFPAQFEMLFKVGDRVRIIHDDADFEGNYLGQVGKIVNHDGCREGMWPWHVEFGPGADDYEIYNAKDFEHAPAVEEKVETQLASNFDREEKLEDEYIEGYLIVDQHNDVLTVFDTYEEAFEDAKRASVELDEPLFIYKMVTAFERPWTGSEIISLV